MPLNGSPNPSTVVEANRHPPGIVQRLLFYGLSRTTTEGLWGLRGVLLATLLGPAAFGIWTIFRLVLRYVMVAALGIYRGLEFEVVQTLSAQKESAGTESDDVVIWGRATLGYTLLVFGGLAILSLAASFVVRDQVVTLTLRAVAAGMLVEQIWIYGSNYLRSAIGLRRFAVTELLHAFLHVLLTALLAYHWGLQGAYVGFIMASVAGIALLMSRVPFRPALPRKRLDRLVQLGAPLGVSQFLLIGLVSVDRLIVAALGGAQMLGFYAFAVVLSGLGASLGMIIRTVIFPDVYSSARVDGSVTAVRSYLDHTLSPLARLLPPILGVIAIALGPLVAYSVPQYMEALPAARVFIFTGLTTAMAGLGTLGLVAAERQRILPLVTGVSLVLNALFSIVALKSGLGLVGVAAGALVAQSIHGGWIVSLITSAAGIEGNRRYLFRFLWPLFWCATAVFVLGIFLPRTDISTTAIAMGVYVLLLFPLWRVLTRALRKARGLATHP